MRGMFSVCVSFHRPDWIFLGNSSTPTIMEGAEAQERTAAAKVQLEKVKTEIAELKRLHSLDGSSSHLSGLNSSTGEVYDDVPLAAARRKLENIRARLQVCQWLCTSSSLVICSSVVL